MKNNVLIFDFDGTIADTHQFIINISNQLAEEFNYKTIKPEEVDFLKDKTSQEVINILGVPVMKIPAILSKAKKIFHQNMSHIKPFDELREILQEIKRNGVQIGILSSNSLENIKKFLHKHNLDIFDFIDTTSKVWSKNVSLKKVIHKNGFKKENVIYIGDETRDVMAAQKLGIKIAAVTWGYNSQKVLEALNPDFIFCKPQELIRLCKLN